jgi:hypothetical protein
MGLRHAQPGKKNKEQEDMDKVKAEIRQHLLRIS